MSEVAYFSLGTCLTPYDVSCHFDLQVARLTTVAVAHHRVISVGVMSSPPPQCELASGDRSAVDIMEAYLSTTEALEPLLGSFLHVNR